MTGKLRGTDEAVEHAEVIAHDVTEFVITGERTSSEIAELAVAGFNAHILSSEQIAKAIEKGFLDAGKKKENG
jgi:hypothetical protein